MISRRTMYQNASSTRERLRRKRRKSRNLGQNPSSPPPQKKLRKRYVRKKNCSRRHSRHFSSDGGSQKLNMNGIVKIPSSACTSTHLEVHQRNNSVHSLTIAVLLRVQFATFVRLTGSKPNFLLPISRSKLGASCQHGTGT